MAKVAILRFPGTWSDRDFEHALSLVGAVTEILWHEDVRLSGFDAAIVPGGFSYGDYVRAGAIARLSPAVRELRRFAEEGGPVLGSCNGFQILCEAGLLPGVLRPNATLSFVCRDVRVRVERAQVPFTSRCEHGQQLVVPVKHGEGSWFCPPELLAELERDGQVVLRYEAGENPNGSVADVAGVCNRDGNVMGLMPHPEHAVDPLLGPSDGALILASLVDAARDRSAVPV